MALARYDLSSGELLIDRNDPQPAGLDLLGASLSLSDETLTAVMTLAAPASLQMPGDPLWAVTIYPDHEEFEIVDIWIEVVDGQWAAQLVDPTSVGTPTLLPSAQVAIEGTQMTVTAARSSLPDFDDEFHWTVMTESVVSDTTIEDSHSDGCPDGDVFDAVEHPAGGVSPVE